MTKEKLDEITLKEEITRQHFVKLLLQEMQDEKNWYAGSARYLLMHRTNQFRIDTDDNELQSPIKTKIDGELRKQAKLMQKIVNKKKIIRNLQLVISMMEDNFERSIAVNLQNGLGEKLDIYNTIKAWLRDNLSENYEITSYGRQYHQNEYAMVVINFDNSEDAVAFKLWYSE